MDIELQPGANPYHAKPYPVPKSHKDVFKKISENYFPTRGTLKINIS